MSATATTIQRLLPLGARLLLGTVFIYLGLVKALDPVGFLKLIRQFDLVTTPWLLNLAAAVLPWFEVFCGILILIGRRLNAAALLALVSLVVFTGAVALRAWALHRAGSLPFCALRFDCGCGTGEVAVCAKLLENSALIALAAYLAIARPRRDA
jgi:uncharacterized membrane protein YphA (DoxX/SURF4 family)